MESGLSRGALRGITAGLRRGRLVLALGALALIGSATMAAPSAFANTPPTCADLGPFSGSAGEAIPLAADCSDADGPSALTYSVVSYPTAGSLSVSGDPSIGTATYTSYLGFSGTDTFTYRAFDGVDYSNTATVTLDITGPSTTNQPPSCPDTSAFVPSDGSVDIFANCTDPENDPISYGCCSPGVTGGTLQFLSASSVRYTPNPGTTTDSFGYSAHDSAHPFSSIPATVQITVTSPGAGTFDTAPDATPTVPYVASLTTTQPGPVTIDTRAVTATPPTGFFLLNQEFDITAPPALDADHPLQLVFTIDASSAPAGPVTVFRDGVPIADCADQSGTANPDPCVKGAVTDANGDLQITALSTHASVWRFGVPSVVPYDFGGFFAPVDNPPVLNAVKAGQAVPVKFTLHGDQGLDVLASGYPKSQTIACDSDQQVDGIESTVTAGSSGLSYDAASDQYTYVWKTDKSWAKSCRQLVVKLDDGTTHRANFSLK